MPGFVLLVMALWCRLAVFDRDGHELAARALADLDRPDLVAVERLAALHLWARRRNLTLVVSDPCPELVALLDLTGLTRQVLGQPEGREEARRVEEAVEPGDPSP